MGEMLFVMVLFQLSSFKVFKHFCLYGVQQKERDGFEERPGSARFGALMPRLFAPFCVLLHSLPCRVACTPGRPKVGVKNVACP